MNVVVAHPRINAPARLVSPSREPAAASAGAVIFARVAMALALLAGAGGCASLDPGPDIHRAAATVGERSGVMPAWTEPWAASLNSSGVPESGWDGRSPLKVGEALTLALRNNRDIRSQVAQIAAARADLVQAGLLPNPVLGLTLRFPVDPVSGGSFVGTSAVQSFTALWLRGGRIRAADARLNQTVLEVSDNALRLAAEVKATHARIAFGQRAVALSEDSVATLQRSIDSLDARIRGGEGTTLDVNRARQQRAKAEAERAVVMRELAKDRRRMLELIGFAGENADWTADAGVAAADAPGVGDASASIDEAGAIISEAEAIALAQTQRLDVAAARCIAEARQAELSVEERSRLNDFALGADFERDSSGQKSVGPVVEVGIPIFDTNAAQIARAGSLARAALAGFEAAAQRAVRETRIAWVELDSARRLAAQHRTTVLAISEQNLILAEAALRAGQADVTVLLEAQREVIEARGGLNDLEREAALAHIALEQAAGGSIVIPAPDQADSPSAQPER